MADYTFHQVLVWETNPGGTVRLLRNGSVTVKAWPSGDIVDTVTSDASGQANFTTTDIGAITLTSPNGLQSAPIVAAELLATAANYVVSEDAAVATLITPGSGSASEGILNSTYATLDSEGRQPVRKGELVVNVKDYGAEGDGSTDDTAAINAAITANPGRVIYVPAGTYMINATATVTTSPGSQPAGILMNQAGTTLRLDPGATLKAITNASERYSVVQVSAPDCTVEGGTITGDLLTHTGSTGQWGYCIEITYNLTLSTVADRCQVIGTRCNDAWADGIFIVGDPADVRIVDVVCDGNRRQGMSITDATRPLVLGGHYMNTGVNGVNNPGAGIDLEPDPGTGRDVVDALLIGVNFTGNTGPGLSVVGAVGQILTVTVIGCRATNNASINNVGGFYVAGGAGTVVANFYSCTAKDNTLYGFRVIPDGVTLSGCTARGNGQYGFRFGALTAVSDCHAELNGLHGFSFDATATGSRLTGGGSRANSQTTHHGAANVEIYCTMTVTGHVADSGALTNAPAYGYLIRSGAVARLLGCDATGAGYVSAVSNSGTLTAFPQPGVAKQTIAAAATDAATTQTLANSLRTALIALGYAS